jgi:putative transposase
MFGGAAAESGVNREKVHEAAIHPYLLLGLKIERPNQVWAADIGYIPMAHGFLFLVAVLDIASRKVLSFRLSNTLTPNFCVEALQEALARCKSEPAAAA